MKKEITSLQHPIVKHLVRLRLEADYRSEQQSLLLEGSKPIHEVTSEIKAVFTSNPSLNLPSFKGETWFVTEAIMKKISGMQSPEGIVAEIKMPPNRLPNDCRYLLILDRINDPGNMGTLMRTALAFGWSGIFILDESCDPYNEKVLRAARGAHFKLPIQKGSLNELKALISKNDYPLYLADLAGESIEAVTPRTSCALIMGNEAQGARPFLKEVSRRITIPMEGPMESLNVGVAGGILLYLLKEKINGNLL